MVKLGDKVRVKAAVSIDRIIEPEWRFKRVLVRKECNRVGYMVGMRTLEEGHLVEEYAGPYHPPGIDYKATKRTRVYAVACDLRGLIRALPEDVEVIIDG